MKKDEMGGTCGTHVGNRNAYKILVCRPEGKRPRGKPRY